MACDRVRCVSNVTVTDDERLGTSHKNLRDVANRTSVSKTCIFEKTSHVTGWFVPAVQNSDSLSVMFGLLPPHQQPIDDEERSSSMYTPCTCRATRKEAPVIRRLTRAAPLCLTPIAAIRFLHLLELQFATLNNASEKRGICESLAITDHRENSFPSHLAA